MLWAAIKGIPKDICRANVCAAGAITSPITLVYLLVVKREWQNDLWPCYLVFVSGCTVGLLLGNIAAKRVSEKRFQDLLTYLLLLAGGLFISSGLHPTFLKVVVVIICACVGIVFSKLVLIGKHEHPIEGGGVMEIKLVTNVEPEMVQRSIVEEHYVFTHSYDTIDKDTDANKNRC